jgi:hypothetical protein
MPHDSTHKPLLQPYIARKRYGIPTSILSFTIRIHRMYFIGEQARLNRHHHHRMNSKPFFTSSSTHLSKRRQLSLAGLL